MGIDGGAGSLHWTLSNEEAGRAFAVSEGKDSIV